MRVKAQLEDIVSYSKGSQINGDKLLENGEYDYLNGGVSPSGKWNAYNTEADTVTVSEGGNSCGFVNYMQEPFWCGAHCYYLFDSKVNTKYLYYILKSQQDRLMKIRSGACMPNIKKSDLGKFEVVYDIDNAEQQKVVDVLDKVSSVISARQQQLQKMDELVKARFVEMFGDPIINSKNLKTKDLKDVLILKAGDFTAASDIADEPSESNPYPCYGGNGIRGYVAEYNQDGEYSLVGRQGALSGNVQFASGKFKNTEHALLVTPITDTNCIWLNQLLLNLDLKRYQTGAAQPGLSVKNLQEIQIICVPMEAQNKFADFVKQLDKSKFIVAQVSTLYL